MWNKCLGINCSDCSSLGLDYDDDLQIHDGIDPTSGCPTKIFKGWFKTAGMKFLNHWFWLYENKFFNNFL